MSNENSKLDAERAAFEEAAERLFGPSAPVRYVRDALPKDDPRYGEYVNPVLQGAWRAWQARANLPVGVPDGSLVPSPSACGDAWTNSRPEREGAYWIRGNGLDQPALIQVKMGPDELECNLHMSTTEPDFGYGYTINQLSDEFEWLGPLTTAAPTVKESLSVAPTVKAEQVDDRAECIADGLSVGMSQEEAEEFADKIAAPSLPAAGYPAGWLYRINPDLGRDDWQFTQNSAHAEKLGRSSNVEIYRISAQQSALVTKELAALAWQRAYAEGDDAGDMSLRVARHVAALLGSQQSAPERVSVPVEFRKVADKILAKLIRFADCAEDFEAGGVDIGRDWLDTLTHLGLLERIQRSPALWQTTDEADAIIDAQRAILASHGRGEA